MVWWAAQGDGVFYVAGIDGPFSERLGPILPAIAAGITAALTLTLVDAVAGPIAGIIAAIVVVALPGFLPVHRTSLSGPMLTTTTVMLLATMVHAPRWSVAHGALAALGAVFLASEGAGLPLAAIAWAVLMHPPGSARAGVRLALTIAPLLVAIAISPVVGHAWPELGVLGWRGNLDAGLRGAGTGLGDQLAPGIGAGTLRWLVIADLTLIIMGVVVVAARRLAIGSRPNTPRQRTLPAIGLLVVSLIVGLGFEYLLLPDTPAPGLSAVFPLAVLAVIAAAVSVAVLWRSWPVWGRVAAVVVTAFWFGARLMG